jgi:hypothetical protein
MQTLFWLTDSQWNEVKAKQSPSFSGRALFLFQAVLCKIFV